MGGPVFISKAMVSVEEIRKLDPEFQNFSDEEILDLLDKLYPLLERLLDRYFETL